MKRIEVFILGTILAVLTIFYMLGIRGVPFHPDESTQLFMSADLETAFTNPCLLAWQANREDDLRQHYRELDAPLTRYVIGIGRMLAGLPALKTDWNWSLDWDANEQNGALPNPSLLLAGRLAVGVFFPFSLLLIFLAGRRLGGRITGWVAFILMAGNALLLLHTRRAMAEGGLVFTICLTITFLVSFEERPWLAAIPAALAFNAKQSAGVMALVVLLAACWSLPGKSSPWRWRFKNLGISLAVLAIITVILNPFLLNHPLQAAGAAMDARQDLLTRQVETMQSVAPGQVLDSIPLRAGSLIAHLWITPPAIAEVANYLEQTQAAQNAYLANPLHSLFRGLAGGGLLLGLSLAGFILAAMRIRKINPIDRRRSILFLLIPVLQFVALAWLVPLPTQRYAIPLVPSGCLLCGMAIQLLVDGLRSARPR